MKRTKLDIHRYTDFRAFLKDRLAELKSVDKKYSLRYLSDRVGLSSKSHLKMVADGSRNLSADVAGRLAKVIGLNSQETAFFMALVRYGQAKSISEQQAALDDLRRKRKFLDVHRLDLDHFDYLNDPLTLTLREMITFPDFQENFEWISERLPMQANEKRIRAALDKLLRLGLIIRDEGGSLAVSHVHHGTGDVFKSVALKTFYEKTFSRASDSMKLSPEERHLGGLTMAISRKSFETIVRRYREFISDVRTIVDEDDEADQVYQLVTGIFPLTRKGK